MEPSFEHLNGRDALAYIVSANIARRNLTKGQQAMALAMMFPEGQQGRTNAEARKAAVSAGFSNRRLAQARSVLRQSHDLADSVIKGSISLDEALAKVEELKQQASSTDAQLERLRIAAPDLATRVAEEILSLKEAMAILYQREEDARRIKETGRIAAQSIFGFVTHLTSIHSAIEAGEDIELEPDILETMREAFEILLNDMQRRRES